MYVVCTLLSSFQALFPILYAGFPEIVIAPSDSEVREGDTLLVTCVANGAGNPNIYWLQNGWLLGNNSYNRTTVYEDVIEVGGVPFVYSTLEICSVDQGNGGNYSCLAGIDDLARIDVVNFTVTILSPQGIHVYVYTCTCTYNDAAYTYMYMYIERCKTDNTTCTYML